MSAFTPPPSRARGVSLATLVRELGGARDGAAIDGDESVLVDDVQQDSRRVVPGDLFAARVGDSGGADVEAQLRRHVDEAIGRGARAILRGRDYGLPALGVPTLTVPNARVRAAISITASAVHRHPSYVVETLGITGTNGKTTTTWLLRHALDALAGHPDCVMVGTLGAGFGEAHRATSHTTPEGDELARLLAWARSLGARHAAVEVSSHALMQERLTGTRIRAAAFTNLTQDHLDFHATMEAYFGAKRRLFDALCPGVSVVCVDDAYGERLADGVHTPLLRVSARPDATADLRASSARFGAYGLDAEIETPFGHVSLASPLVGAHNLSNLLVALGVLVGIGVDASKAARALSAVPPVPGRLELISGQANHGDHIDDVTVLVDYAHTPDALVRALQATRSLTAGRVLCVFGCGGDRDPTKRGPMGRAVAAAADVAIVTSDNPRTEDPASIVGAIMSAMGAMPPLASDDLARARRGVHSEVDRATAIARAIAAAAPGDIVLVAGKGHEDYQIVGTDKRPFDDRVEARRALALRRSRLGGR